MPIKEMASFPCPHCLNELYQPLEWFKEETFRCPDCQNDLTARDFAELVSALEEAMEESCHEMIQGKTGKCCCGNKGKC